MGGLATAHHLEIISYDLSNGKRGEIPKLIKLGRPLKEKNLLSHDVKVRLDDETYERLSAYCGKTGEKAPVIREAIKAFLDAAERI